MESRNFLPSAYCISVYIHRHGHMTTHKTFREVLESFAHPCNCYEKYNKNRHYRVLKKQPTDHNVMISMPSTLLYNTESLGTIQFYGILSYLINRHKMYVHFTLTLYITCMFSVTDLYICISNLTAEYNQSESVK